MHVTITYWSCTLIVVCACVRACDGCIVSMALVPLMTEQLVMYLLVVLACMCVSVWVRLLFHLLYLHLRWSFWIFPLFRLNCMLPPYMVCNRLLVGRSNIEFRIKGELCFDQIISFLYILRCSIQAIQFSFENPLKQKNPSQNVQIGEY